MVLLVDLFWDTFFSTNKSTWMNFNGFLSILGSARGPTGGPTNHVFQFRKHSWDQMAPRTSQGPPKGPQGPKNHPETSIFFNFGWCSDDICHVIFARDSLAAFQASQDQTKIEIVAPSFQSIRLHISQAEYPERSNTFDKKTR